MTKRPSISVIMSVHNGRRFLSETIESVLAQSWSDFEFIIVDDGSSDGSTEVIRGYAERDSRLQVLTQEKHGLTRSLNRGLTVARGEFVARQDADDISAPERLAVQRDYMQQNPNLAAVGSWCRFIDEAGVETGGLRYPVQHEEIAWAMLGYTAIAHPSAMLRRSAIDRFGAYDETFTYAQDYELWTRWISLGAQLQNIPKDLIFYRVWSGQISLEKNKIQTECALRAATKYVSHCLGRAVDPQEVRGLREVPAWCSRTDDFFAALPALLDSLGLFDLKPGARRETAKVVAGSIVDAVRRATGLDRVKAARALVLAGSMDRALLLRRSWWRAMAKAMPFRSRRTQYMITQ
jgi:hypothetical protein